MNRKISFLIISSLISCMLQAQPYFGCDLSYINQMEDCGAVFRENDIEKDAFQIFADHGTNLVRVRLWHTPTWQNGIEQPNGVRNQYSDYPDVLKTIQRAHNAGMQVMLGFQLSDAWADPGRQVIPQAWLDVATDLPALKDSVYNYIIKVLGDLNAMGNLPEFVKIGNETNSGIMYHETMDGNLNPDGIISSDWTRHAELFKTAIQAVRDFTDTTATQPKIALHSASLSSVSWWYNNITNRGITDFDIIGFSYYYAWHEGSISQLGAKIRELKNAHPGYEVMVIETGYLWSERNYDNMPNIITTPDPEYLPVSKQKQLEYMIDFQREVLNSGGAGSVFWEPAWVSTPCSTLWGQGTAHDHVAFFDPYTTNFMSSSAGSWAEDRFYTNTQSPRITFIVNMTGQGTGNGIFLKGSWSDQYYPMLRLGDNRYAFTIYELDEGDISGYYFLNDTININRENVPPECALWGNTDRSVTVGDSDMTIEVYWESCNNEPPPSYLKSFDTADVLIFPNPAKDKLHLQVTDQSQKSSVRIFDLRGNIVSRDELGINQERLTIGLTGLSAGIYYVEVANKVTNYHQKIVVN